RIVLAMLIAVVVTAALAALVWSPLWWVHGAVDLSLAGYLTYLRRQVKIEQDIRNRRLARLNGERRPRPEPVEPEYEDEPEERRGALRPCRARVRWRSTTKTPCSTSWKSTPGIPTGGWPASSRPR